MSLLISAYNIHSGGGEVLLDQLLDNINESDNVTLLIDERYEYKASSKIHIIKVRPSINGRLKAEFLLRKLTSKHSISIFMGNLPPLFKVVDSKVFIYIQNRYLVDKEATFLKLPLLPLVRTYIEKLWLKWRSKESYHFLVQTLKMQSNTKSFLSFDSKISLFPYFDFQIDQKQYTELKNSFLYIASGETHKNHLNLLKAWKILNDRGVYPKLTLVMSRLSNPELFDHIRNSSLREIVIYDNIRRKEIQDLYAKNEILIFPSLFESYGLPLIEAQKAGKKIIASELDYVRDVVDPIQTFDPYSAQSIARAVSRQLEQPIDIKKINSSKDFYQFLLSQIN